MKKVHYKLVFIKIWPTSFVNIGFGWRRLENENNNKNNNNNNNNNNNGMTHGL